MELVERIARVIAGSRVSVNAEGGVSSAATMVDAHWRDFTAEASAILRTLRDPSPTMVETGMGQEWRVLIQREIDLL